MTKAVMLLGDAQAWIADHYEGVPKEEHYPRPAHGPEAVPETAEDGRVAECRARLASVRNEDGAEAWTSEGKSTVIRALASDVEFLLNMLSATRMARDSWRRAAEPPAPDAGTDAT